MAKAKLKDLLSEVFEDVQKVDKHKVSEGVRNFSIVGKSLYNNSNIMEVAKQLAEIAESAHHHILGEQDDWFDKISINKNMKHLKGSVMEFQKTAKEAHMLNQRLTGLYEDIGHVLNRYYDIPETHIVGHDDDDRDIQSSDTIEEGDYEQFFQSAMKKFGIKSPDELGSDEKKKKFFNYVDKNYKAKAEGKIKEGGKGSGRKAKPGSAKDIDNRMSAAVADANARLDAAEQDSEEAQQPGKRDDDKDIKYY